MPVTKQQETTQNKKYKQQYNKHVAVLPNNAETIGFLFLHISQD